MGKVGVSKDADDSKLKTAYKKLALKHHPDRNPGKEEEASAQFKEVSRAYEVLSDSQLRARYDQFGEEGLEGGGGMGGGMGGMDPQDLFSQLFGGGGGMFGGGGGRSRGPQGPRKGKDLVHKIKVTMADLYKGKTSKLALQKHVLCSKCNGKGGKDVKSCNGCNGQGIKLVMRQMGPMIQQYQQTCSDCNGEGEIISPKDRCKGCSGKKVINERKVLEVNIDKGMKDGQQITFTGEADQAPNTIPGDVVIVVEEKPHEKFRRRGDDIYMEQNIDLLTALAGGKFLVEHLDDRHLMVEIIAGEVIKPGAIKVIPEQGMPAYRHHNHGQLIISFTVDFPTDLSPEAMAALESALPARPTLPKTPKNHIVDEVVLQDADPASIRAARAAEGDMDEDDEDGHGHQGQGVSCANQ